MDENHESKKKSGHLLDIKCLCGHRWNLLLLLLGLFVSMQVNAQNVQIKGYVKDNKGEPLIGAVVLNKNTNEGTATDGDGSFSLTATKGQTIAISYVGYHPQSFILEGQTSLNVILEESAQMLSDVVVVGYGTIDKKEVTSAISHVSSKDLLQISTNNPVMQLQGKVAGVNITNQSPADPNSSVSIQVRGSSSRAAGLGPLIVIDGVPGGNLNNINENDIESIDVLKDGAASAIYGTRGSNGVIIVTTKSGGTTDGSVTTDYNGYVSFDYINDKLDVLSRDEFLKHERGTDFGHNTNWFDAITRTGVTNNHSLSISGGNNKNNYRGTVDYRKSEGVDLRSDREEIGARINLTHQSKKHDLYTININLAPRVIKNNKAEYGAYQQALLLNPTQPIKNPDDPTGNTYFKTVGFGAWNPVEALKTDQIGAENKMFDWNITFKLNLLPVLMNTNGKHTLNTQLTLAQQINEGFTYYFRPSYNTVLAEAANKKGQAKREYNKSKQESAEWLINYHFATEKHNLKLMGGYSYQYFQNSGLWAENMNFTSDALSYNHLGDGSWYKNITTNEAGFDSYKNDSKLIGFFGRASYDYMQKYLFTASLRYEGSSKFGANHKWGYFPAVSGGWRISEESFMKDIKWIDELKIRGDFGITGNQDFSSYLSIPTMVGYGMIYYRGELFQAWGPGANPNPDLKWEKGVNWNVGIDFALFNSKVYGSLNYYNRKSQDLLGWYSVATPPNLHSTTFLNVGTMVNRGIEIELKADIVNTKDFSYSAGFVASTNGNKLVSLSNDQYKSNNYVRMVRLTSPNIDDDIQELREGKRIGNFYTYAYAGVDDNGKWLVWNKDNTAKIPFSQATDEDKRIVGNGLPEFTASLNQTFRYKQIDLSVYLRGMFGYDIYNIHNCYYGIKGTSDNVLQVAYTKNDHINDVNIPSDYFIEKGDHLKIDVITLGYTFPIKQSKWIESLRLYATGRNLATFTGFSGVDPQSYTTNGLTPGATADRGYYPSTTQVLFGVQLGF